MSTAVAEQVAPSKELRISPLTESGRRLSENLCVLPLRKGQTARYKLIASDQYDLQRTEATTGQRMKNTPGYSMCGKKTIYDPYLGETVTIMNKSKTYKKSTSIGEVTHTVPQSVKFSSDKPVIEVGWDQPELYAFMERTNDNRDNPFRDPNAMAYFYRMDSKKKNDQETQQDALEFKALKWIREESKPEDLKACAMFINEEKKREVIKVDYASTEASTAFQLMKKELYSFGKKEPALVLRGSNNNKYKAEIQMHDAEFYRIIIFVDQKMGILKEHLNHWIYFDDLTPICSVEPTQNKFEALVDFISKGEVAGRNHYMKITELLKKVLTPR